jgi:hypothetical protein
MTGMAYNLVLSSFLLKAEIAYFDNYDNEKINPSTNKMVGLEYKGISDGSASVEMALKGDVGQYAIRFNQSYLSQTLTLNILHYVFLDKDKEDDDAIKRSGGFNRMWIDYVVNDTVLTSIGVIDYLGGINTAFDMVKDNDRVFASLQVNF